MDEVYPNLWLGQYQAASDGQTKILKQHKITHIVSIGLYEQWWTTRKDPKHLLLEMKDSPFVFVTDYFSQVFPFMEEALAHGNGVLVHCEEGKSRSSAIVVAFLMKKLQKQYPETLNRILIHRKKVMPNIGFQIQVVFFLKKKKKKKIAKKFKQNNETQNFT
ncbi:dual specificity protein phosphatase [Reticulomyxa filosa]|uniref:Dual specificity protein phosphatase n=1 Tax=Reticulomyxa filosa TaxID=46433 RepID=X6NX25_RETFI|nr:dual specificity protein phosphatase [Reticulomyxa filosa]|eukprot:ETO30556.1 dual specificity protein phosphatase [Reticulomyxa filosa]